MANSIIHSNMEMRMRILVSKNLKKIRKSQSVTQEKLSDISGISMDDIKRYETGKSSITLSSVLIFAKSLEVNPEAIFDGWEEIV